MKSIYTRELKPAEIAAICHIKEWVGRSMEDRDEVASTSLTLKPSIFWRRQSQTSGYMRAMPPEEFKALRLHTYHFDADTYMTGSSPQEIYERDYNALRSDLPERFQISAPPLCGEYGYLVDGHLVNYQVLKWQETIRALCHSGQMAALEMVSRPVILEIGGGYGALAHHFSTIFPNALYFLLDIPEQLLFSASYLTLVNGEERVLLLDRETEISLESLEGFSFVMVPNSLLGSLSSLHFHLSINMSSFHEMTEPQVIEYLEFLSPKTDVLLSANSDQFESPTEKGSVTALLSGHFNLEHLPAARLKSPKSKPSVRRFARKVRDSLIALLYWSSWRQLGRRRKDRYLAFPKIAQPAISAPPMSGADASGATLS